MHCRACLCWHNIRSRACHVPATCALLLQDKAAVIPSAPFYGMWFMQQALGNHEGLTLLPVGWRWGAGKGQIRGT